jgi:23S rRNA (cytosine1962-C5)-methyltransferase
VSRSGALTRPRRYQLRKSSLRLLESGHPWIFRGQLSSAAQVFRDGQWLALVGPDNRPVGSGIYEAEGAIAVRVLERSPRRPDAAWVDERVAAALARREPLRGETDAFRALHGENDGLPAVVVDVYGDTAVLMTYSTGAEAMGRLAAAQVRRRLGLRRVVWKPAHRRRGPGPFGGPAGRPFGPTPGGTRGVGERLRALCGQLPDGPLRVREEDLELWLDVAGGQKSGAYLDLRGLRRWVAGQDLGGRRVLNLFSYTGWLGLAAERAGAELVVNVDSSQAALAFAAQRAGPRQRFAAADVFEWLPAQARTPGDSFDLVLADPPPMTSRMVQVERALSAYRRLYRAAAALVAPGGHVAACCCTSRVSARAFVDAVAAGLGPGFRFVRRLPPEIDHPVGFPEADYLKVVLFARAPAPVPGNPPPDEPSGAAAT